MLRSRARLRLAQGRIAEGSADLVAGRAQHEALGWPEPALVSWSAGQSRAARLAGDLDAARTLAERAVAAAVVMKSPPAIGTALRIQGEALSGEPALAALRESVEVLAASEARLEHGHSLVAYGAALRRAGRRTEARAALAAGLEIAHRALAAPLVAIAEEELRTAGARPRRRELSGVAALTASEHRIATLAASGQTNREIAQSLFLTVKTVEMHLSNAYRKLGIDGRAGLSDALAEPVPA